jgi:hypothetical protein
MRYHARRQFKKRTTTRTDDPPMPTRPPSGPPRSGWVQQIAAGNAGWRSQFRFAVHADWSRVPELWTLAVIAYEALFLLRCGISGRTE